VARIVEVIAAQLILDRGEGSYRVTDDPDRIDLVLGRGRGSFSRSSMG
jgi:hypothetical protein